MVSRIVGTLALVSLLDPLLCPGMTYMLNQPDVFGAFPYGFSGTITTDGSTGLMTTTDFVDSWSITVFTPDTVDGLSSETLTPSNSAVSFSVSDSLGLEVSADAISMSEKLSTSAIPLATLTWATNDGNTTLQFTNRFTDRAGLGAGVNVFDPSEQNATLGVVLEGFPIATLVPEPTTSTIALTVLCLAVSRNRTR